MISRNIVIYLNYVYLFFFILIFNISCSHVKKKSCLEGGQTPRETPISFKVIRSCYQQKDPSGVYMNHGKYYEWYANEKIALEGEYEFGKKTGRWIEYDKKRNKILDESYKEGKKISNH